MISRRGLLLSSVATGLLSGPLARAFAQEVPRPYAEFPRHAVFRTNTAAGPRLLALAEDLTGTRAERDRIEVNPWLDAISDLDQALRDNENKARLARYGVEAAFAAPLYATELAAVSAPAPWSYGLWFVQKQLEWQNDFIIDQVDENRMATGDELARSAARALVDSRGLPYDALFPLGDPSQALANIDTAVKALAEKHPSLSGDQRAILLATAAKSLRGLIETGSDVTGSVMDDAEVVAAGEKLDKVKTVTEALLDREEALAKKGNDLSEKQLAAQQKMERDGDLPRKEHDALIDAATDIVRAGQVSGDVVDAAVALGMDPKTGEDIMKVSGVVTSAAQAVLGFASGNPYLAISGVAQVVSGLFGKKRKGPGIETYLSRIAATLSQMQDALDQIARTQKRILANQRAIANNQVRLALMGLAQVREIHRNRQFLVDIIDGPIWLLEREVERFGLVAVAGDPHGPTLDYARYVDLFDESGDLVLKGMGQLENVFPGRSTPHALLQRASYAVSPAIDLDDRHGVSQFRLVSGAEREELARYKERVDLAQRLQMDPMMLTEAASYGIFFYGSETLRGRESPDLALPDLDKPLIETGILLRLARLALATHHIHQLVNRDGARALKTEAEILAEDTPAERGFLLLENVLRWVELAISQQLLLSRRFDITMRLYSLSRNNPDVEFGSSYATVDPDFKQLWDVTFGVASLDHGRGIYDARWVDKAHIGLAREWLSKWAHCDRERYCEGNNQASVVRRDPGWRHQEQLRAEAQSHVTGQLPFTFPNVWVEDHVDDLGINIMSKPPPDLDRVLRGQFALELQTLIGNAMLSPSEWDTSLSRHLGPWARAYNQGGRTLAEIAESERTNPPEFRLTGLYDDPRDSSRDQMLHYCKTDIVEQIFNTDCPAPPAWSRWDDAAMRAATPLAPETSMQALEIYRDPESGRFEPVVEQLLLVRDALLRQLTAYRLYKTGDAALKSRWIAAVRGQRIG